jgi:hypothetical protein
VKRSRRSRARKREWADPEIRGRRTAGIKLAYESSELRAKIGAKSRDSWQDPAIKSKLVAGRKRLWKNRKNRRWRTRRLREIKRDLQSPEAIKKRNATLRTPEARKNSSQRTTASWANPEIRPRMLAGLKGRKPSKASNEKRSASMNDRWKNPNFRQKNMDGRLRSLAAKLGIKIPLKGLSVNGIKGAPQGGRPPETKRNLEEMRLNDHGYSFTKIVLMWIQRRKIPILDEVGIKRFAQALRKGVYRLRKSSAVLRPS